MSNYGRPARLASYYSFTLDALERAVKTAAQTAVVTLGAEALDVFSVDWLQVAGMAAGGAVLSVLTSVASAPLGPKGAATIVDGVAPEAGPGPVPPVEG